MEQRLIGVHEKRVNELIWILEHNDTYTSGKNFDENEILDKNLPTPAQWQDIIKLYQNKISDATTILQPKDFENLTMGYTAVGRFSDAVRTLDNAIVKWPKFENRNNLIYRAGFIAWEYLQDTKLAEKYYTQFLNEYPNNEKASEVKEILNSGMLEMSDEAILNTLKGK